MSFELAVLRILTTSIDETRLNLSYFGLMTVPKEILRLVNLQYLDLSNNDLLVLPDFIGDLQKLEYIDIRNNDLVDIPRKLYTLKRLKFLNLKGNQLEIPIEVISKVNSPESIFGFHKRITIEGKRKINEAKVIFVGQGGVGKTSLVNALLENKFEEKRGMTDGINIDSLDIFTRNSVRINIWDFGGQEIMHSTHQFFLTKRSVYVLVIDNRQDEYSNQLEYWLKIIRSFSKKSPILIVGNKSDQKSMDLDMKSLMSRYDNIKGFIDTSCLDNRGIKKLKKMISKEIANLPHIYEMLPISWFEVKKTLEILSKSRNFLPYSEYIDLCRRLGVDDDKDQEILIEFLHDLGSIVSFQDDRNLQETNVLNPRWVTSGVYKIINSPLLSKNKGILRYSDIKNILSSIDFPRFAYNYIINVMIKFELCFPLDQHIDQSFLIPDVLPKNEPNIGEWTDCLIFQYRYDFLPSSIISRFIVRMKYAIKNRLYWRFGVVLSGKYLNETMIKMYPEEKMIIIHVRGDYKERRGTLSAIRMQFESIHSIFPDMIVNEYIPVPGLLDVVIDYEELLFHEKNGQDVYLSYKVGRPINIKTLLDGYEDRTQRMMRNNYEFEFVTTNDLMDMKKQLIDNLRYLKMTEVSYGFDVPLYLRNQLDDVKRKIHRIDNELLNRQEDK